MVIVEPNIDTNNTSASIATSNYNYNNENYYSKDDMSVYDDVNNNRLNLHTNNNGDSNAYEERNIYVANNILTDRNANDSLKTYIHIEVYKGNLDGKSTVKTATAAKATATTPKPKDIKSMKALQLHHNNGTNGTAEISTTKL